MTPPWRSRNAAITFPKSFTVVAPSLVDRGLRRRFDLTLVELTRQKALDDGYLLALLLREIGTVALLGRARSIRGAA